MKTQREAESAGKDTLKKMRSQGWVLRVWENSGWNYSLTNSPLALYPYGDGTFFCMMSNAPDKAGYGYSLWSDNSQSKDPNKAVNKRVLIARQRVVALERIVIKAEAIRIDFEEVIIP